MDERPESAESGDLVPPLPTSATSPAGSSRPGTGAASVDCGSGGAPVRSPLLRQPRSPSVTSASPVTTATGPAQGNKQRRVSVFMRRQSVVPYMLARLAKPKEAVAAEPSAAQIAYSASQDPSNPYRTTKDSVLKQFYLWNGLDVKQLSLPPLPSAERRKTNLCHAWDGHGQAVRQLGNLTRNGPRHFAKLTRCTTSPAEMCPPSPQWRSSTDVTAVQKILQSRSLDGQSLDEDRLVLWHTAMDHADEMSDQYSSLHSYWVRSVFLTRVASVSETPVVGESSKLWSADSTANAKNSQHSAALKQFKMSVRSKAKMLENHRRLEQKRFLHRIDRFIEEMRRCAPLHTIPKKAAQS